MKKGISLISLIITIVAIIILASITVFTSLNTLEQAQLVKMENEFRDVSNYVRNISVNLEAGLIDINLTEDTLVTDEQIKSMYVENEGSEFTEAQTHTIKNVNEVMTDNPNKGYHYITAKDIEYGITGINESSNLDNVKNNYIINFYYGTVIAKVSPTKTLVSGVVK